MQCPQHDVGIGDGRIITAQAVTSRPGIGTGAARADLQQSAAVDECDRAAAGAHGMDIQHRRLDRIAVHHGLGCQPAFAA